MQLLPRAQLRYAPDPPAVVNATLYHSRGFHSTVVAGQNLWIDGGNVIYDDGTTTFNLPANDTYSIDLSTPWTNATVVINQIVKSIAPVLIYEALWPAGDGESFYMWGGEVSHLVGSIQDPDWYPGNDFYQFVINGAGGSWNLVGATSNTNLVNLARPSGGASTVGNGVGYLFGGYSDQWSTLALENSNNDTALPGLISYDMGALVWTNHSTPIFPQEESGRYGQLEFIPVFGPAGLLMTLGGGMYPETVNYRGTVLSQYLLTFQSLKIFEPKSGQWYTQTATGQIPDARANFCSVGVSGDNGTYEIFIYGGFIFSNPVPISLDSVYVLSLPSFNWQKADYPAATPRYLHTCEVAGNRQMISIGGFIGAAQQDPLIADIWPLGLGVFDLTEMSWKDHYDPSAAAYQTPATVKKWYSENGLYPKTWDSPGVEALFRNSTTGPNSQPLSSNSHSSNAGAIAGGVIGGVVVLAAISSLVWFYKYRKPKHRQPQPNPGLSKPELPVNSPEIKHPQPVQGSKDFYIPELGSEPRHEISGGFRQHEMP